MYLDISVNKLIFPILGFEGRREKYTRSMRKLCQEYNVKNGWLNKS